MIKATWSLTKNRGSAVVPDVDTAEREVRAAIFADAGANLTEGHGLICHEIGRAMHHEAEPALIVNGRWEWSGHGYSVVLTTTEGAPTVGT